MLGRNSSYETCSPPMPELQLAQSGLIRCLRTEKEATLCIPKAVCSIRCHCRSLSRIRCGGSTLRQHNFVPFKIKDLAGESTSYSPLRRL